MEKNETGESKNLKNARVKYQAAIVKNASESEIQWSRYNAMLVFNTILIAAIGFIYDKGSYVDKPQIRENLALFLPLFGLISCYLWFQMTARGFQWIEHWIISARELEEKFLKDECTELNPILKGNEQRSRIIGYPRTKTASYILIILIAIFYVVLLLPHL